MKYSHGFNPRFTRTKAEEAILRAKRHKWELKHLRTIAAFLAAHPGRDFSAQHLWRLGISAPPGNSTNKNRAMGSYIRHTLYLQLKLIDKVVCPTCGIQRTLKGDHPSSNSRRESLWRSLYDGTNNGSLDSQVTAWLATENEGRTNG